MYDAMDLRILVFIRRSRELEGNADITRPAAMSVYDPKRPQAAARLSVTFGTVFFDLRCYFLPAGLASAWGRMEELRYWLFEFL